MRNRRVAIQAVFIAGAILANVSTYAGSSEWPMYGRDLHHSFARPDSIINASNAASLVNAWTFSPGDAVTASPTVADGVVYVGSWDGFFYALDIESGSLKWKFQVDCDNAVIPIPPQCLPAGQTPPDRFFSDGGLITSSATVFRDAVYFAGGKTIYALRASDGQLMWKRVLCGNPDEPKCEVDTHDPTRIFSSPTIFDNKIVLGQAADAAGYRGAIQALHLETGTPAWRFEVDPKLDAKGKAVGVYNRGCGNVWGSGAVDELNGLIAFGTGDCNRDATPPYHEAVLAFDVDSGKLRWAFRPRANDTCDFDFGASANILDIDGNRYVGIGGKDGTYYVLRSDTRNPAGELRWSTNVVFGGNSGGFIATTAFDGQRIYGGTGFGDIPGPICDPSNARDTLIQEPSFHALDLQTGKIDWEGFLNYTFAPSTVGNGVIFDGWAGVPSPIPASPPQISASLRAYDAATGHVIAEFAMPGQVNSAAAIVNNMLFFGTGNTYDGAGSSVQAFAVPEI
jgi:polyvinyl alcohol dehydrogenase (cytochrome)